MTRAGHALSVLAISFAAAGSAHAELPVLPARDRSESELAAVIGTRSFGVGAVRAEGAPARGALAAELTIAPIEGVGELRAARSWRLTAPDRLFSANLVAGASSYLLLRGPIDFGAGPNAGIFAGWGRRSWGVWLGAQAGVEAFARTFGPRAPLRAVVGVRGRVGDLGAAITARGGVDLDPAFAMAWRGELALTVGWFD